MVETKAIDLTADPAVSGRLSAESDQLCDQRPPRRGDFLSESRCQRHTNAARVVGLARTRAEYPRGALRKTSSGADDRAILFADQIGVTVGARSRLKRGAPAITLQVGRAFTK